MTARLFAAPISLALIPLLAAACSSKAGDDCSIGKHVCLDRTTLLACNTGRYVAVPCKGPGGCVDPGSNPICDFSHNEGGGECPWGYESKTHCTADGKSQIGCVKGKWLIEPCRGTGNCAEVDQGAACNRTIAEEGDPCSAKWDHSYACDTEGVNQLMCNGEKFVVAEKCVRCEYKERK